MNNHEALNNNKEENQTNTEKTLGSMPSFEEHMKRPKNMKVQRFVDMAISMTDNKEKTISDALDEMTPETALNFLQHVNSQLRNDKIARKSEVYGDKTHRMVVDANIMGGGKELVAPEPELQKELFNEYFDAIKKIEDKDKKALLAYYAINNLHLFSDGNGRTSRTIYSLIKNGNLSDVNDLIMHNDEVKYRPDNRRDGDDGSGRKNFISKNNIKPVEQINAVASVFLQEQMEEDGTLDGYFSGKHIYVYSVREKDGLAHVVMSKKNRQGLNDEDTKCLDYAMSDGIGGGNYSTLSGLTMAIMLQEKELSKKIVDTSLLDNNRLPIRVNFDQDDNQERIEGVKNIFANWTVDDYIKTIEVYRRIKRDHNRTIIRFFTEDLKWDSGESIVEWAMGK